LQLRALAGNTLPPRRGLHDSDLSLDGPADSIWPRVPSRPTEKHPMSEKSRTEKWRLRAEELRAIADGTTTVDAKDALLRLANGLDAMAQRNEAVRRLPL
jgi:hypothetical protein